MKFAALIALALGLTACGVTDNAPPEPPYCTYDGFVRICDGDTVKVKMLGTGNNALSARGVE